MIASQIISLHADNRKFDQVIQLQQQQVFSTQQQQQQSANKLQETPIIKLKLIIYKTATGFNRGNNVKKVLKNHIGSFYTKQTERKKKWYTNQA